jgi:hypothetical protein
MSTYVLTATQVMPVGMKQGFKTLKELNEAWLALEGRDSWGVQYITDEKTNETIAFVLAPCDPQRYKDDQVRMDK